MKAFLAIAGRDLGLAARQGGDGLTVLGFFVLTVILFPLGVGPEANILARIAPGVIWVTALLASMLSLERLFAADYEDGSLDLLATAPGALELAVLAKILAHWLHTGLPLMLLAPFLALLLNMEGEGYGALLAGMALGTPVLSLIGAIGAALVLGARRGGVLLSLLVLPLCIPVLIFGVGAVELALIGQDFTAQLLMIGAFLALALPLAPVAAAAAIRQALE